MKINFFNVPFCKRRLLKKVLNMAMIITGNDEKDVIMNLSFVGEDEIKNLNKTYRNVDRVTDVLSFPLLEKSPEQKLSQFASAREPSGQLMLGDVVICTNRAKQQAREYGHSVKREIAFLATHGLLHILGYDHIEKDDERIMNELAENVLLNFNIKRGENV